MRSGPLALRAAVGAIAATAAAAAPVAVAAEPGPAARVTATVTPATVTPGGDVEVQVKGCGAGADAGSVRSAAFVMDVRLSGRAADGTLHGDTTVRSTATPGTYPLVVDCAGRRYEAAATLLVDPSPSPTAHALVRAGGGGLAPQSAELLVAVPSVAGPAGTAEQGPGTRHTVIGLVLAAVAAVAVALRGGRRKGSDDTGAGASAGRRTGGEGEG